MSETNEWLSQYFPVRPHVIPPLADGTTIVTAADRDQLTGLYPFAYIPSESAVDFYVNQNVTVHARIIFDGDIDSSEPSGNLLETTATDISAWVNNFGTVTRKVDYLTGRMSPSSHSFDLMNSDDIGDYLFTLRSQLGLDYWMYKEYNVYIGFNDECKTQWLNLYSGRVVNKTEDRISGKVNVSSNDLIKELNDYKVCTSINASNIFDYETTTSDTRGLQEVIKYGIHKLIINDEKQIRNRSNPFSCTFGIPSLIGGADARPVGSAYTYRSRYNLWYFPFQNEVIDDTNSEYSGNTLKVWYWDYRQDHKIWRSFTMSEEGANFYIRKDTANYNGLFVEINTVSAPTIITATWDNYINGTALSDWEDDNPDPMLIIESQDALVDDTPSHDPNPVRILHDLVTSSRYIDYPETNLDMYDFDSPDVDNYTWDKSYSYFEGEGGTINTDYKSEMSLMSIINDLCLITGLSFFASKKVVDADRRIKLIENSPLNPAYSPLREDQLIFSTKDKLSKMIVKTSQETVKNNIITSNFSTATSTRENIDINTNTDISTGDIERTLNLTSGLNAYWYDSNALSDAIGQRYLFQFKKPVEIFNVDFNKAGFEVEVGELVDFHDAVSDETLTAQVFSTSINVKTAAKKIIAKRYPFQLGPNPEKPCELWLWVSNDAAVAGIITDDSCPDTVDNNYWVY